MDIHSRMESLADLLIAGGLSAEEKAEAERHAAECAGCGTLLRDAREFSTWTKGVLRPDAPQQDHPPVVQGFEHRERHFNRRFLRII